MLRSFFTLYILVSIAWASPAVVQRRAWPSGSVTCGSNVYTLAQVKAAVARGVEDLDDPVGSNSYPHAYYNYEGLDMWCTGESSPYNEFPILESGLYTGQDPSTDRVVFADDGTYCAVVTHTGASGDDFVACDGD
ncbi:hypothetical protein GYMLUDRAFT_231883 [Collybiopsis luxurians FD-317 M1]|uniref:Uncharacterized protein n=1 Tax=Collybiopsis luxurians FD-317 M1 TaxID=944289 RepID=A0A0D0BXH0_9AGAR|nr:hypothetical protein GYMLUDRAFT_231883 [Collybiopsis luxurians FD-317 M1]